MAEGEIRMKQATEQPKRKSGLLRAVGFTKEETRDIFEIFEREIEKRPKKWWTFWRKDKLWSGEPISRYERQKTEEEIKSIQFIFDKLPEFIKRYGGNPVDLRPEYVHIIDRKKTEQSLNNGIRKIGKCGGFYTFAEQFMGIIDRDKLSNMEAVVHEAMHFNSFLSVEKIEEEKKYYLDTRRSGLSIANNLNKEENYFGQINEAITCDLQIRFEEEFFPLMPELTEELKNKQAYLDKFQQENPNPFVQKKYLGREYVNFRRKFHYLTNNIKLRSLDYQGNEQISNEQIFNMFARSYFSGKLLPLARLIENKFGKGSFRKLGEEYKVRKE